MTLVLRGTAATDGADSLTRGRLDARMIGALRFGLVVAGALYTVAVILDLGGGMLPPGETAAAALCFLGAAATYLRGDIGRSGALVCALFVAPLSVAFHNVLVAQVWVLLPAQALAVYLRMTLTRGRAWVAIAVLCLLLDVALFIAPAPTPIQWRVVFPLVIFCMAETMGALQSTLLRAAMTDALTGLWNRIGLEIHAAQAIPRALGSPVAVAMIDVVGMKSINDTDGHLAGDQALVDIARILHRAAPRGAVVARVGGDEFLVVAGVDQAVLRAALLAAVADSAVPVTIGVADGRVGDTEVVDLVRAADVEMYRLRGTRHDLREPER